MSASRAKLLDYHVEPERFRDREKSMYPVILFLHGWGENGTKGNRDYVQQVMVHGPWRSDGASDASKGAAAQEQIGRFIVIAPHLPDDREWEPGAVRAVLDGVLRDPTYAARIDRGAMYLTGISWGARGALRLALDDAARTPRTFAAVALISLAGAEDFQRDIRRLAGVPVWFLHGDRDGLPTAKQGARPRRQARGVEALFTSLHAVEPRSRLTIYPGVDHSGAWIQAFDSAELYDWLLSYRS